MHIEVNSRIVVVITTMQSVYKFLEIVFKFVTDSKACKEFYS